MTGLMVEDVSVRCQLSSELAPGRRTSDEGGPWLRIPGPPPVPKATIWQYTTTAGLIGIVVSDRLWATAVSVLNDVTELRYGLELAELTRREFDQGANLHPLQARFLFEVEYAAKAALRNNAIFVVCGSRDGDDLGQWRGYAEGGGYAIGSKAIGLCAVVSDDRVPATWEHRDLHVGWQQVLYEPIEQKELLMSWGSRRRPGDRQRAGNVISIA